MLKKKPDPEAFGLMADNCAVLLSISLHTTRSFKEHPHKNPHNGVGA
jgi:hypothetical protein